MTKETEETNKVPLGLYFLDVLFFFFYINCASIPANGNTCGRGSIIPPMRPHNLPWYWFATHIPLNKVHINSKRNKETGSNCFKTIVLRIFLGWENLVEFLCTTASLKLKLQYNIPLHPTAKNPGQRYHLSHYHCKNVNKSIKNQQRYVPNTQSTGLVLRVQ